jgi:hypothetical protein
MPFHHASIPDAYFGKTMLYSWIVCMQSGPWNLCSTAVVSMGFTSSVASVAKDILGFELEG